MKHKFYNSRRARSFIYSFSSAPEDVFLFHVCLTLHAIRSSVDLPRHGEVHWWFVVNGCCHDSTMINDCFWSFDDTRVNRETLLQDNDLKFAKSQVHYWSREKEDHKANKKTRMAFRSPELAIKVLEYVPVLVQSALQDRLRGSSAEFPA